MKEYPMFVKENEYGIFAFPCMDDKPLKRSQLRELSELFGVSYREVEDACRILMSFDQFSLIKVTDFIISVVTEYPCYYLLTNKDAVRVGGFLYSDTARFYKPGTPQFGERCYRIRRACERLEVSGLNRAF